MNAVSAGGCERWDVFFTVNLAERKRTLLMEHIDALRMVMKKVKVMHTFRIDAMVILPDHLHALGTLPEVDATVARGGGWRASTLPVPYRCLGVSPDHLHCIWTLPAADADFSTRWRLIKSAFAKELPVTRWRRSRALA